MANTNPVYLSLEDWETVQRALRDAKQRAILVERDHPNHPRIAHAARVEAERIGAQVAQSWLKHGVEPRITTIEAMRKRFARYA
jgi:uncharacterized protein (UPF0218 family)